MPGLPGRPKAFSKKIEDMIRVSRPRKSNPCRRRYCFRPQQCCRAALPDESFDRVLSSLVFSLLSSEDKQLAASEAYRALTGGGELYIADFGPPHMSWGRLLASWMRRFEPISDNLDGRLPIMFREAGFRSVEEVARFATILGTISILAGLKPD